MQTLHLYILTGTCTYLVSDFMNLSELDLNLLFRSFSNWKCFTLKKKKKENKMFKSKKSVDVLSEPSIISVVFCSFKET